MALIPGQMSCSSSLGFRMRKGEGRVGVQPCHPGGAPESQGLTHLRERLDRLCVPRDPGGGGSCGGGLRWSPRLTIRKREGKELPRLENGKCASTTTVNAICSPSVFPSYAAHVCVISTWHTSLCISISLLLSPSLHFPLSLPLLLSSSLISLSLSHL